MRFWTSLFLGWLAISLGCKLFESKPPSPLDEKPSWLDEAFTDPRAGLMWLQLQKPPSHEPSPSAQVSLFFGTAKKLPQDEATCEALAQKKTLPFPLERLHIRIDQEVPPPPIALCLKTSTHLETHWVEENPKDPYKEDPSLPPLINYARLCAREVMEIPSLNCLDGYEIPITEGGSQASFKAPVKTCDRPAFLGQDGGQCITGGRLLVIESYDLDVEAMMICRRYVERELENPFFDDIGIIAHRRSTGATCFFQMPNEKRLATNLPSPLRAEDKPEDFWLSPKATAERKCLNCHDSDPFIWSPYLAQLPYTPGSALGPYQAIGEAFKNLDPQGIDTVPQSPCTLCHRIGANVTCESYLSWMTGRERPPGMSQESFARASAITMPPDHGFATKEAFEARHGSALTALQKCCQNPKASGCQKTSLSPSGS